MAPRPRAAVRCRSRSHAALARRPPAPYKRPPLTHAPQQQRATAPQCLRCSSPPPPPPRRRWRRRAVMQGPRQGRRRLRRRERPRRGRRRRRRFPGVPPRGGGADPRRARHPPRQANRASPRPGELLPESLPSPPKLIENGVPADETDDVSLFFRLASPRARYLAAA